MKIVSWNCNGAFRKKFKSITNEKIKDTYIDADIYVIQECEDPQKVGDEFKAYKQFAGEKDKDYFWVGNYKDKGLGIFNKSRYELKEIKLKGNYEHFIAVEVNDSFNLLGVWAMDEDKEKGLNPYVEMIHDFWDDNKGNEELFKRELIICGDFNSSSKFDKKHKTLDNDDKPKDHTHLHEKLDNAGLVSAYHYLTKEESGYESRHTFFQARHLNVPFHLDYFYINEDMIKETKLLNIWNKRYYGNLPSTFEILDKRDWINLSDHLPIVLKFEEK